MRPRRLCRVPRPQEPQDRPVSGGGIEQRMQTNEFDVVIVGSGASGGTLASHLARRGVRVAIVEGGPRVNTRTDFNTHAMPFDFPNRQIPTMKPGKDGFDSERSRGVGGKTMLWNAVALRLSSRDFKGRTYEGAGEDWPIDYEDLAPYYAIVEREVGVCGQRDGLEDLPDGEFLPPVPLKCSDEIVRRAARSLGADLIPVRKATLTVPTSTRLACHFCGNCMAGCDVVAKYNSADVHIAPAEKSGYVTVFPDCIVREVLVSDENRATGVRYLHRVHRREGEVRGRTVVLACACVQSIALLLMSTSRRYPRGLANSSGQIGRHFIPHFTGGIECVLEDLRGTAPTNDEGFLDHAYMPSFMHKKKRPYARSFGAQLNYQNRRLAGWAKTMAGFGRGYKARVKAAYPAFLQFTPYGEMLPNPRSYVDLDPRRVDKFGLPAARRHVEWSDNDAALFNDMVGWSLAILEKAGAEILTVPAGPAPNHELGGCRMGADPRTSVVNADCRTHDVRNLYVVDGSVFPSASEKNPTHTIMALAVRAAEHIATEMKRGNL
jgi:choline dehydrogenase-like flavoprotein